MKAPSIEELKEYYQGIGIKHYLEGHKRSYNPFARLRMISEEWDIGWLWAYDNNIGVFDRDHYRE